MGNIRTAQFGYDSGQGEPFGIVMEYVLQLRNPSGSMLVGTVFIGGRVQNPVDYAPMWALGAYDQLLDSGAIFFYKQCPYRLPELVA